jgi:hypothetical protein
VCTQVDQHLARLAAEPISDTEDLDAEAAADDEEEMELDADPLSDQEDTADEQQDELSEDPASDEAAADDSDDAADSEDADESESESEEEVTRLNSKARKKKARVGLTQVLKQRKVEAAQVEDEEEDEWWKEFQA